MDQTLEEIQALARGVYPALLADRGLPEALRAAALRLPLAATVNPDGVGRYPADIENAVYFCCLEAMQNASKHALDAARRSRSSSAKARGSCSRSATTAPGSTARPCHRASA